MGELDQVTVRITNIDGVDGAERTGTHHRSLLDRNAACTQMRDDSIEGLSDHQAYIHRARRGMRRDGGNVLQPSTPSRAVPMKLLLSSIVVKLSAPSGRCAMQPYPHAVSASAITVAACRYPFGARNSGLIVISAVTIVSSMAVTRKPKSPG